MEEVPFLECLGTKLEVKLASSGNSKNKAPERYLCWPVPQSFQQGETDFLNFPHTVLVEDGGLGESAFRKGAVLTSGSWQDKGLLWDFPYL